MSRPNQLASEYTAKMLRDVADLVICHRYHRNDEFRLDKLMFDLVNVFAHAYTILHSPTYNVPRPPTMNHSNQAYDD